MKKYLRLAALLVVAMFITSALAIYATAAPTGGATDDQPGYNITFTVKGEGTVHVYQTVGSVHIQDIKGGSQVTIRSDKSIKFTTTPNIDFSYCVTCTEPKRDVAGDYYFLTPSRDSQVTIDFTKNPNGPGTSDPGTSDPGTSDPGTSDPGTSDPGTSDPGTSDPGNNSAIYTVTMEAGVGGSITIGNSTAVNQTRRVMMEAGSSFEYVITADEGYEIKALTVGGEAVNASGSSYKATVTGLAQSLVINATFAPIGGDIPDDPTEPPADGISVSDVTGWDSDYIVIYINEGEKVLREVFTKISQLPAGEGKYVEFVSVNGSIYVPFGAKFVGTSASVDLFVYKLTSGAEFDVATLKFGETQTPFAAYKTNIVGEILPAGTLISFKTEGDLANALVNLYAVSDKIVSLKQAGTAAAASGITEKFKFNNEPVLVCAMGDSNQHTVEIVLPSVGGNAVPNGINTVPHGATFEYTINAANGYAIKQILVDGVAVEGVAGQTGHSSSFVVEKDCVISVEFEEAAAGNGNGGGSNAGTIILVLVIVIVALLGAAALFIVKWRQEKF